MYSLRWIAWRLCGTGAATGGVESLSFPLHLKTER